NTTAHGEHNPKPLTRKAPKGLV
ncbi:MAG: hypothetical protein RL132_477, partial [Pseudomonadota bacterium]